MPLERLIGRLLGDRRKVILLSLVALGLTVTAAAAAGSADTIGPSMLLPWVALFAFEAGPGLGLLAGTSAFWLYTAIASADGFELTPGFVAGRFSAFALIGVGVGVAGQKLRSSERRSRRLVEGLPLVMYTENGDGLTYISPQIEPLLGYPAAAWRADPGVWRGALHEDDHDRVIEKYTRAVAERADFECDYRLSGTDGRCVWVRDRSAFVPNGRRSYRQGFIVDITETKESEAKAERNALLMRGLVDGTVDGITLTDRDGRIVVANEPMLRFVHELGIPREGRMHERLLAISDSISDRERFERRMRELAEAPDVESFDEFELRDSDRVFQGYTQPVLGANGSYLGRVWTLREVTAVRQADRIKDALVATVSHELRTPLTSIVGYLELLADTDEPLGEANARYVEIVRRNAQRLQRMVEDLLFVARVDAGGISLDYADADVAEAAVNAIRSAGPAAAAKELTLDFEGPASAETLGDPNRLGQVFDNLISNAIKFTPAGGNISVTLAEEGDAIVGSVSDNGCGIPASEQPRLFERFFRSTSTAELPGTGLGLTIVRAIVEGHGGSINCDSAEGKGTTFTFSLPRRAVAQPPRRRALASRA